MIEVKVPGSKSITNRALLIAALAKGKTKLSNALQSDDTRYMRSALLSLGAKIDASITAVHGTAGKLHPAKKTIFCGNAGTAMRFLTALLSTQDFSSKLDGNVRMRNRPIRDLEDALMQLGVEIKTKKGAPPVYVRGPFKNNHCTIKGDVSSQFLSGLLIAAPLSNRDLTIDIKGTLTSKPYIDMTIQIMQLFGVRVKRTENSFSITKGQRYRAVKHFSIEPDASSASYFLGISLLTDEKITITDFDPKTCIQADVQFLKAIEKMRPRKTRKKGAELRPLGKYDCSNFPDGAMTLAVLCAFAKGKSHLTGLSNLRVKESDRLHALSAELTRIGCKVKENADGLTIFGDSQKLHGGFIRTYDDHRMAMCFGMASLVIPEIKIQDPNCVKKTYPNFWNDLKEVEKKLQSKNIVLTGMRGTGKTVLGHLLAKKLGRTFIDLDEEISRRAKKTISEIVEQKGWSYFRKLEKEVTSDIAAQTNCVISTGGGTVMDPENRVALKSHGVVIHLDCPISVLEKRLKSKKDRPALTTKMNFIKELRSIYAKRKKQYLNFSDVVLDVSKQTTNYKKDVEEKTAALLAAVHRRGITYASTQRLVNL